MAVKFEQYPVTNIYRGKPLKPRLESREARRFRTVIREGASAGTNFAGEFTIVSYGCGSCCDAFFIVNARTGKVYSPPFYVSCHFKEGVPGYASAVYEYRLNSKLLIVQGARNEIGGGEYYYLWENNKLKLLKSLEEPITQ